MTINRLLLFFLMFLIWGIRCFAQERDASVEIAPVTATKINKWRTEVYMFGAWNSLKNANLWTANNNIGKENADVYQTTLDFGVGGDFYKDKGLFLEGNIAYTRGTLAYSNAWFPRTNVTNHWITMDTNISYVAFLDGMFYTGVKSSYFLNSSVNNTDSYSFEGFYDDCFNRITFTPYFGIRVRFQYFKFDVRIGQHVVPYLNSNKIAYHNMHKTYVEKLYLEVKAGVKLFSTSNPSHPINTLFLDL